LDLTLRSRFRNEAAFFIYSDFHLDNFFSKMSWQKKYFEILLKNVNKPILKNGE